jgi:dTDP-4-amino-4,6-dideoxygalactose transaminase
VTNDDDLADKLHLLMNHAEAVTNDMCRQGEIPDGHYLCDLVGMNMRMTELSAAVAREQLKKLDGILKVYREHAKRGFTKHHAPKVRPNCEHAYYRYALMKYNNKAVDKLTEQGDDTFNCKRHYIMPIYKMPLFKQLGYPDGLCPVCEDVEDKIVLAWLKEAP